MDILNCRLERLDYGTLGKNFITHRLHMKALLPYRACLIQNGTATGRDIVVPTRAVNRCLSIAISICKRAKIRAVKTIRFGAYMINKLLKLDPEIKIIHSVRDPRGMLLSAIELGHVQHEPEAIRQWMDIWCYRMHVDNEAISKLNASHHILQLRYEDLVTRFNQSLHRIYSYINRDLPPTVLRWFVRNTRAPEDNGPMGTSRTNATETAYKWRRLLANVTKVTVEQICSNVLQENGY